MGPFRLLLLVLWTICVIYPNWGEWSVGLLLMGHSGLKVASGLATFPIYLLDKTAAVAIRVILTLLGAFALMYLSVAWFGWWCFWALFVTFVSFTVERK